MGALSYKELNEMVDFLQTYVGCELQEFRFSGRQGGFCFGGPQFFWLWLDLTATAPMALPFDRAPVSLPKEKKPIHLFVKANLIGEKLEALRVSKDQGRILFIELSGSWKIEIRLFPHGQNIIIEGPEKSLSLYKPKDVVAQETSGPQTLRSLEEIKNCWLEKQVPKQNRERKGEESLEKNFNKEKKRKEKAIVKVQTDLESKKESQWREVGQWIKEHQSLEVPEEFVPWVDNKLSLAENIENCFQKAKQQEVKLVRSKERLSQLKKELDQFIERGVQGLERSKKPSSQKVAPNLLQAASVSGRTLKLENGRAAYLGKNAKDNLKLLRKARAWDFWLHVKDQPGSHAIIRRNKSEKIPQQEFEKVGRWLIKESFGAKAQQQKGLLFEIIIAECRYVKPIKGDRLGRVNYSQEKILPVRWGEDTP